MKKILALILALSMMLCFVACGGGSKDGADNSTNQSKPEEENERKPAEPYYPATTGLYPARDDRGDGYIRADGTFAFDERFMRAGEFVDGVAVVETSSTAAPYSAIDAEGNILFAGCERIGACSEGWFFASPGGKGNKNYIVNKNDKREIEVDYDNVCEFSEGFACVSIGNIGYGKYGYIDNDGNLAIQTKYDGAGDFREGLAPVKLDGKWGYIDINEKQKIDFKYDRANSFSESLAAVEIGGKWGYIDRNDNMVIAAQFDYARDFSGGYAVIEQGDKYGMIDKDGNIIVSPQYDKMENYSEGLALFVIGEYPNPIKSGFVDQNGNEVNMPQGVYSSFSEGLAVVRVGNLYGYVDVNGNMVIEPQFDMARDFKNELARVRKDFTSGYINKRGEFIYSYTEYR